MKYGKLLIILTMLMGITTTMSAKDGYKAMKVYMFGVSISFNDSIVNFTVFIRLFAEIPLGILVARDQIHRPGIENAVPLS